MSELTKREEIAARAMQGMLSAEPPDECYNEKFVAGRAVLFADALLAELAATEPKAEEPKEEKCYEKEDRFNDCPRDFPSKECPEYTEEPRIGDVVAWKDRWNDWEVITITDKQDLKVLKSGYTDCVFYGQGLIRYVILERAETREKEEEE